MSPSPRPAPRSVASLALLLRPACLALALLPTASAQGLHPGWEELVPGTALPALSAFAMAYDPVAQQMVLFGGYTASAYSSATYTFDGSAWTRRITPVHPSARAGAGMAYDADTQQLVLFGGFAGSYFDDTWLWDAATGSWSEASPSHVPKAVTGPSLFSDPITGQADQYGGFDGQFYQLKTWRWSGGDWNEIATAHAAFARAAACSALDPIHHEVLVFGGLGSVNTWNTWTFDGIDWHDHALGFAQPPNRYSGAAGWDDQLGRVIVFGGGNGTGVELDDTWEWTGSSWVQLLPDEVPPGRESHGMGWFPPLSRVLVVAGEDQAVPLSDDWTLVEPGAFVDVGPGVGGAAGVPELTGHGDLTPGSGLGFTLDLDHAPASALAYLFLGGGPAALPFHGGTFYPAPVGLLLTLPCDAAGHLELSASMPLGVPAGPAVVLQAWAADATAPKGAAGSNGLLAVVP